MRTTTWAEDGVICTVHLAQRGDVSPGTGRDIAAGEKLPSDDVEQILLRLRRAGIVKSTRGATDGSLLSRAPEAITLREVVSAAELGMFELHGDTHPLDPERCAASGDCSVRPVWQILKRRVDEALEGVRLSDLLAPEPVVRGRVGLPVLQP